MKILLALFVLISSNALYAQKRATIENLRADKIICTQFAEKAIAELKNGTLLVRLDFRQREVDYYVSNGNKKEGAKITEERLKINSFIVKAFKEYYTFSSVYFFAMKDSEHIVSGNYDSVTFYNTSFEIDSIFRPTENAYLIAEFGVTHQDTATYYSDNVPNTSRENPKQVRYYGGSKNSRAALIVMDRKFNQIEEPFPYYATYNDWNSLNHRFGGAVERLNKKLNEYFDQTFVGPE